MFECVWGARYDFNMWTGGQGPRLKLSHPLDTNPAADFRYPNMTPGHMKFFDMYPLADGRWFKCPRPDNGRDDSCGDNTAEHSWSPSFLGGSMNNWNRWVYLMQQFRLTNQWIPGCSCPNYQPRAFRTALDVWRQKGKQMWRLSDGRELPADPRIYLGYQLVSPDYKGGPCSICASIVCTECMHHCKTCNIDVCIDCQVTMPFFGLSSIWCLSYRGWERTCPQCSTIVSDTQIRDGIFEPPDHEKWTDEEREKIPCICPLPHGGPYNYGDWLEVDWHNVQCPRHSYKPRHNPEYIFFCSDAVEKAGMCKPGCFCKYKPMICVEADDEENPPNLGDALAEILGLQKRHTVAMGLHARLGADSILQEMDDNILKMILTNELVDRDNMADRAALYNKMGRGDFLV